MKSLICIFYTLAIVTTTISCGSKMKQLNEKMELKPGKYYLDIGQKNFHSFKHFNVELKIENDSIKLYFISSEEFGYSELWKKDDIYAEGKLSDVNGEGILIKVWENRGDSKALAEGYIIKPTVDGFDLIMRTERKDYIDHYSLKPHQYRISHELLNDSKPPEDIERYYKEIERSLLDFKISKTSNRTEYILLLNKIEKIDFPYNGISTHREFLTRMGFSLGFRLNQEKNWQWSYLKDHRNEYLGWTIISPDKTIGISIENYFFEKSFRYRDIEFNQLILIIKGETTIETEKDKLTLYEPWLNYGAY